MYVIFREEGKRKRTKREGKEGKVNSPKVATRIGQASCADESFSFLLLLHNSLRKFLHILNKAVCGDDRERGFIERGCIIGRQVMNL